MAAPGREKLLQMYEIGLGRRRGRPDGRGCASGYGSCSGGGKTPAATLQPLSPAWIASRATADTIAPLLALPCAHHNYWDRTFLDFLKAPSSHDRHWISLLIESPAEPSPTEQRKHNANFRLDGGPEARHPPRVCRQLFRMTGSAWLR